MFMLGDSTIQKPKSGYHLYISRVCNFLRIVFHIGYIPLIIYFGVTNQGHPLDFPISLWNVFIPLSMGQ
uniref:Hypotheticial protein n=1 Tax=Schistosoma japonicum TaxID=6182 RepID=C1LJW0_SCHJA|nr:hypotheticial protein [Schistosoma japonicum]CAX74988.1 hypotheticial protein [Schistosoma japonicum]CAX74990.1 hypotheticial protein [Schistosoma japonicum]